jgi:hypothetical protein
MDRGLAFAGFHAGDRLLGFERFFQFPPYVVGLSPATGFPNRLTNQTTDRGSFPVAVVLDGIREGSHRLLNCYGNRSVIVQ